MENGYLPRPSMSSDQKQILHGGNLQSVVLMFKFYQNQLVGFQDVGEIYPFPLLWPLAYTTACTTIQAVINML